MVDITSLITLQARSRRNALRASRQIRRERLQAEQARSALAALTQAPPADAFAETRQPADHW